MKNLIKKTTLLLLLFMAINVETKAQTATLTATDPNRVQITAEALKSDPLVHFEQYFSQMKNAVGSEYEITGFRFTVAAKVGQSKPTIQINGNKLNELAIEMINSAQKGDIIIIDGVVAKSEKGNKNLPYFLIDIH